MRVGWSGMGWIGLASVATVTLLLALLAFASLSPPSPPSLSQSDGRVPVAAASVGIAAQAQATATGSPNSVQARTAVPGTSRTPVPANTNPVGSPSQQQIPVRRGPLVANVQFDGRISAANQAPLSFVNSGTIDSVLVTTGQTVTTGQVLMQLESSSVSKALEDARTRSDNAILQLQLTQNQSATMQQDAEAQAQEAVRRAQDNLARVQAGPSSLEHQSADQGVVTARAALDKAQADLNKLQSGSNPTDIANAQRQIEADQLALRSAQAAQAKLLAGTDALTQRAAERDLTNAQDALKIAK